MKKSNSGTLEILEKPEKTRQPENSRQPENPEDPKLPDFPKLPDLPKLSKLSKLLKSLKLPKSAKLEKFSKCISKHADAIIPHVMFILLISVSAYVAHWLAFYGAKSNQSNKESFYEKYKPLSDSELDSHVDSSLLTHKLIAIDNKYGVSNEDTDKKAVENVNRFIGDVSEKCDFSDSNDGISKFVSCANEQLGKNFYYTQSVDVSNNYAVHRSDCDTNTYLMMDALKLHNIKSYVVYAPGHAFLAWKDKDGNLSYQETTAKNNYGEPADLKTNFYIKNLDRTYYTPYDENIAEKVYVALISGEAKGRVDISDLYSNYKWNAIISDWYFDFISDHDKATKDDAIIMANGLKTDLTSSSKALGVTNYLIRNNKMDQARYFFNKIDGEFCTKECFDVGVKLRIWNYVLTKPLFKYYDEIMSKDAVHPSSRTFFQSLFIAGISSGFIIMYMAYLYNRFFRRKKKSAPPPVSSHTD